MDYNTVSKLSDEELAELSIIVRTEMKKRSRARKYARKQERTPRLEKIPMIGERRKMFTLYVLLLEHNKYYIGITSQRVQKRFAQHQIGKGAKWTSQYPPIGILESKKIGVMTESQATVLEREKTHELIGQYGAENVRGGDLCYMSQKHFDKNLDKSYQKLMRIKEQADADRLNKTVALL